MTTASRLCIRHPLPCTCCIQVFLGRPGGRFQSGAGHLPCEMLTQCWRILWAIVGGRRQTCHSNECLLSAMIRGRSVSFVLLRTESLVTKSYHFMFRMRRCAFMWKACSRAVSALVRVHVSDPCSNSSLKRHHAARSLCPTPQLQAPTENISVCELVNHGALWLLLLCAIEVLLLTYLLTYYYATPKVGHLPPVKCPPSPVPSQTPLLVTCPPPPWLRLTLNCHTAYPYLAAGYRNAASIGSSVWALT